MRARSDCQSDNNQTTSCLTNFDPAALTHVARLRSVAWSQRISMTPWRASPRCSHHVTMRRTRCESGGKDPGRRRVSPAQRAREPALPMRRPPHGGTTFRGALAAAARRARHRSLSEMRRSAPRIRAHLLPQLPSRLPACLLMQGAIFLPELPPKTGACLWGLGRGKRSCARTSPAIRLHRTPDVAADIFAPARAAWRVVPYRGAIVDQRLFRCRGRGTPGLERA